MTVNIADLLDDVALHEDLYPGKRLVKKCQQIGEFKNHCVVFDWRDPDMLKILVKPGLSGTTLAPQVLKNYPVCLQSETYAHIAIMSEDDDRDEEREGKSSSSGGGQKLAKKKLEDILDISARFTRESEGALPTTGRIVDMVVMGAKIADNAIGKAFDVLKSQIKHAKIAVTEIMAQAADIVTRIAPPQYVPAKGNETARYNYDREKNADIGMSLTMM